MSIEMSWTGLGVIFVLLGHAVILVKGWTTVGLKLDTLNNSVMRLDKELEKRDTQIAAAWKKIDGMNNRLTVVETRVGTYNKEEV